MKAMAREPDLLTPETWTAIPPEWAHETLYFAASFVLHPTALGLRHASLGGGDIFTFSESNPDSEQQCRFCVRCNRSHYRPHWQPRQCVLKSRPF
jgi:hypothetical protein